MKKLIHSWKLPLHRSEKRSFGKLWASHALSQIANYILLFLLLGRIFEITKSTVAIGMLWIAYALPILFLGPFAGSLVDCWSKRKTLIYTNILQALVTAIYGLTFYLGKNYLIYAFIFFYSVINQFNNPAELAAVPALVRKKSLVVANNILIFTDQGSFILGSSLSGILTRLFSPLKVVFIAAIIIFLSGLSAAFLPSDIPVAKISNLKTALEEVFEKIKEGYQFLASKQLILYSFGLIVFFQVITTTSALLIPSFSSEILKLTPYDASYLIVFPLACGVIGGTLLLARNQSRVRKKEWIGSGLLFLGLIIISFALLVSKMNKGQVVVAPILAFTAGLAIAIAYAPCRAFIQETTPLKIRGRIFGTLGFLIAVVTIPPGIFTAMIADLITVRGFLIIAGLLVLSLGIFILKKGNDLILAANHRS